VREHGGLVIADEVQTGLGRTGEHMWAFSQYEVSLFALFNVHPVDAYYPPGCGSGSVISQRNFTEKKHLIIFDDLLGTGTYCI
jgi:hypothetical protein